VADVSKRPVVSLVFPDRRKYNETLQTIIKSTEAQHVFTHYAVLGFAQDCIN